MESIFGEPRGVSEERPDSDPRHRSENGLWGERKEAGHPHCGRPARALSEEARECAFVSNAPVSYLPVICGADGSIFTLRGSSATGLGTRTVN